MDARTLIRAGGPAAAPEGEWLSVVKAQVEGLRYGVVQVIVHDSRVVQVERTERIRLDSLPLRDRD
jgi:hypothetical protein